MVNDLELEVAVPYWDSIARTLAMSTRAAIRRRVELKDAGIIFYKRQRGGKRIVFHFPSRLKMWSGHKGKKDETI